MHTAADRHGYSLFGLRISSDIELPELIRQEISGEADVDISIDHAKGEHLGYCYPVQDVATFYIENGSSIIIAPVSGVPPENVRLFLLGSVFGVLLQQRAMLPLHANAIVIGGKAFAFSGPSGSGKSTLAAWFYDKGYKVLADDICVIESNQDGGLQVVPGLPRLRLWRDALERSGRASSDYLPSYAGTWDVRDKYDVPLSSGRVEAKPTPLAAIIILESGQESDLRKLGRADALISLMENTYRGELLKSLGALETHFELCARVASKVDTWVWKRPLDSAWNGVLLSEILGLVETC